MRAHTYLPFLLILLFIPAQHLNAAMRPLPKIRKGTPPTEVLKKIIRTEPPKVVAAGKSGPLVTWLTEPDERLAPLNPLGEDGRRLVYTVTCPASQLLPSLGAVDFGVRKLLTPVLLIAGSSDSRFIKLFMEGYREQDWEMRRILDHLHLPLSTATTEEPQPTAAPEGNLLAAIEKNIDFQVQAAITRYRDRIAEGRLLVAGGVYDLDNAYGHGANRLILINLNGETDPGKMRMMRAVATIGKEYAKLLGRSKPVAEPPPSKTPENQAKGSLPAGGK